MNAIRGTVAAAQPAFAVVVMKPAPALLPTPTAEKRRATTALDAGQSIMSIEFPEWGKSARAKSVDNSEMLARGNPTELVGIWSAEEGTY